MCHRHGVFHAGFFYCSRKKISGLAERGNHQPVTSCSGSMLNFAGPSIFVVWSFWMEIIIDSPTKALRFQVMLGFILPIANLVPQLQPQAGHECGPHGFFSEKIGISWIHDGFFLMKKTCKILGFLGFVDLCFGDFLIEKRF